MKINLGEVLSKAWQITWKFKVLWIFGILAGCSAANNNRFNYNFNNSRWTQQGQVPDFFQQFQGINPTQLLTAFWNHYAGLFMFGLVLLCGLWLVFYFLGVIGKTGLILGVGQADGGADRLNFGELWRGSLPYFWRMFWINILAGLPFFIIFVVMIGGLLAAGFWTYSNQTTGGGLAAAIIGMLGVFLGGLCVLSILSIIIGMIVEQAQNAIVLENLSLGDGVRRGWKVFKSGLVTIIVIAIILGVIGFVIGLLFAIPAFLIAIPAGIAFAAGGGRNIAMVLILAFGCFLIYLPFLLLLNGIMTSYIQSIWTLTYRRLTVVPDVAVPIVEALPPAA